MTSTRSSRGGDVEANQWDCVADEWVGSKRQRLWRQHSTKLHRELITDLWREVHCGPVLKTDLFEESLGAGLVGSLTERFSMMVGLDLVRKVAIAGRDQVTGLKALQGDLRSLPFADDSFEAIVSTSSLDHFRHWRELAESVNELFRVLRPGGELLLTMDNVNNPIIALRNGLPWAFLSRTGLVPYFVGVTGSRHSLSRLLSDSGFVVNRTTAIMHCPRVLIVPICAAVQAMNQPWLESTLLKGLRLWEQLGALPTRYYTGHFVVFHAAKPQ